MRITVNRFRTIGPKALTILLIAYKISNAQVSVIPYQASFETLKQSIVRIDVQTKNNLKEMATGFIISSSSESILILTAAHVVREARSINVAFYSNRVMDVPARKMDNQSDLLDLAVLEVRSGAGFKTPANIPQFHYGADITLRQMSQIYTVDGNWSIVPNTVTGLSHDGDVQRFEYTSVSVGNGFSGGPIFDNMGNVIGMHDAMVGDDEKYAIAIKIQPALQVLDALGYNIQKLPFVDINQSMQRLAPQLPAVVNPSLTIPTMPTMSPLYTEAAAKGQECQSMVGLWIARSRQARSDSESSEVDRERASAYRADLLPALTDLKQKMIRELGRKPSEQLDYSRVQTQHQMLDVCLDFRRLTLDYRSKAYK